MKLIKGDIQITRNLITGIREVIEISSDLQLTVGHGSHVRIENTTATIHTVTLPTSLTSEISQHMIISNLSSSSESINIATTNTVLDEIKTLGLGQTIHFIYNGSLWQTVGISSHADLTERDIAGNHAKLIPLADGTTAIQITKADGSTVIFNVDSLSSDPKVTVTGMLETIATDTADSGDNIQNNGVIIDGDVDTDKQILFRDNGVDKWALQGAWRNESGEFFYLYNLTSDENILVVSQNGRFSFNKPTNIIMEHAAFVGTGLNDLTPSGLYTERINRGFNIEIDSVGTPDTFKWSVGTLLDGFVEQATNVPIVAGKIPFDWGIEIEFGATTGHTLGDKWAFRAHPQDALDTMTVKPAMNDHVFSYNGTSFFDVTYQASTTHCSIGSTFTALNTVDYILYIGNCSKFNSSYFIFEEYGAGITLVVEYWNGSTWVALTSNEGLIDTTTNFTANGSISWDKSTFPSWTTTTVNGIESHWLRFRSSTNATTVPTLRAISRHTDYRFAVYSAHNDTIRAFDIKGDGITEIFEANRLSTATTYRLNEFITEARLRSALSLLIAKTSYFTNNALSTFKLMDDSLPATAFSVAVSVTANSPTLIQKWVESDAYGKDMVGGERFESYLFLQRSNASRGMTFYCELWQVDSSGVDILLLGTSNTITAPANTNIGAYDFDVSSVSAIFGATDRLAVKVYALRTHPTTQTVTLWGGTGYPSQLDYPSETVTLEQLLEHFEEDISGSKSQWKAKGTGTDIDIELVPKGDGIVRTTSNMTVDGSIRVSDNTDVASASIEGSFRYYKSGNNSYVDVCMQTGASTYAWVNIVQNNW